MTTTNKKHEIIASLGALDQTQSEKVLEYIKGLVHTSATEVRYVKLKREAMKEIRQALSKNQRLNAAF
jgi:hypothetical protein